MGLGSRKWLLAAALGALLSLAGVAVAASPHFVRGPDITDLGQVARVTGTIAGLGGDDVTVRVDATGTAEVVCISPGGNVAPGQQTTATASGSDSNVEVKNGRASFDVTTDPPPDPDPAEVCPNSKWDAEITDVDFTSVRIRVFQPSGSNNAVLDETFSV